MDRPLARHGRGAVLALLLLLAGCATAPTAYHAPAPIPAAERPAYNLRVFDRAWELVNDKFFDAKFLGVDWKALRAEYRPQAEKAGDDQALYLVVNRMLGRLKESHLVAMLPKNAYEFRTQYRAGVGLRMALAENRRVVTEVIPASPAEAAGVQPGWIILARDGVPIERTAPFSGEVGQAVTYAFLDGQDRERSLTMQAALLTFERREARVLAGGVLYLRFDTFNGAAMSWLSQELKAHRDAPAVIVDLRQNPGGQAAVLLVSLGEFFDRQVDTGRFVHRGGCGHDWDSIALFSAHYEGRVAVLVDNASASSAEIFAHVLQRHGRAVIVGRQTAGAVMGANFYALPRGGRLEVPVFDYIGVDGRRLEARGVTPDVVVPRPNLADLRAGRDADVAAALTELRKPRLMSRN